MGEGKSGAQGGAERPTGGLGDGAEHLEFAASERSGGEGRGVERFEIGPAANDRLLGEHGAGARVDPRQVDRVDRRAELKRDTVPVAQPLGQGADRLARVDGGLGRTPQ